MNNLLHNQKGGTAIMMTVLILSVVLTVTLAAADIVRNGLIMGHNQVDSTKAYFAAETGAEQYLWEVFQNGFDHDPCDPASDISFNNGDCGGSAPCCVVAPVDHNLSNGAIYQAYYTKTGCCDITFISSGIYSDNQRNIEINYCIPDCAGKECGVNGCSGSCGVCGPNGTCVADNCSCNGTWIDCLGICDCDSATHQCSAGPSCDPL